MLNVSVLGHPFDSHAYLLLLWLNSCEVQKLKSNQEEGWGKQLFSVFWNQSYFPGSSETIELPIL